ncbi:MAG: bifunctional UDP-sugar hydrolase/5'-nucleotidase [Gordonibacter sp.]|nr:bifunctional UDP-sugar hydrolase/5'-nucleotidase [Gordonibacter sp.]
MKKENLRKLFVVFTAFTLACSLFGIPFVGWAAQPSLENSASSNEETESSNTSSPSEQADTNAKQTNDAKPIVILHTNDAHCEVNQTLDTQGKTQTIGYAGVSSLLKEAETSYGKENVTLVDAGDAIQGKPLGTLSQGSYLIDIMKKVGYDIAVPGNHEFDYGMERFMQLVDQAKSTQADMSSFGYVSCNFKDLRTNKTVLDPYQTIDYPDAGIKVAYIGISTPESLTKSSPANFKDEQGFYTYGFCEDETGSALYEQVQATVDAARAAGANYVIAVGHLGETGVATPWRADTVIGNTSGIDAFIDGHSHEQYEQTVQPNTQNIMNRTGTMVPLAQTGTQLQSVGKIVIDPTNNTLTCNLITPPVNQDTETLDYLKGIEDDLSAVLDEKVAHTAVKLIAVEDDTQKSWAVRMRETNLGDLCADAVRTTLDADVAFVNGGGIRSDVAIGDITYENAISVMPFGNSLCKIETTGQAILDALEMATRLYPQPSGGFLQVSGLTYELRSDIATTVKLDDRGNFIGVEGPRRIQNVYIAGQPLDPTKTYTLAATPYLLKDGGDGFVMFNNSTVIQDEQGLDYEALIRYLRDDLKGIISTDSVYAEENGEGRILVKNGPDPLPTPTPVPTPTPTPLPTPNEPAANQLAATGDSLLPAYATASTLALCSFVGVACVTYGLNRKGKPEAKPLS